MSLRNIIISLTAVYMIGAVLTGFTYVQRDNLADMGSVSLVSSTLKYGVYWPFQLHRVVARVL